MTYPTGTPVHTFLLPGNADENVVENVVVVLRESDGEIRNVEHADYRDAQRYCRDAQDRGAVVLVIVEGERDLARDQSSVWVAR